MAKRAFNLGEELRRSGVPTVDTREQIEYIPLESIDPDPENFYSLDGIDELAGSIELVGLQQPLRVRDGEHGHVIVVSGHRRRAACMLIRDGGSDMFKGGVPCIRERPAALPEMQELKLIFGNAQTRVLSAPELSRQAVKTRDLIAKLRSKGYEFQGRTRELVATVLQTSDSRIGRLTAIREKLVPELLNKFDEGLINETSAYRMTQEPADVQSQIWRSCGTSIFGISAESVELVIGQIKRKSAEQAPAAESFAAPPQVSAEKAPTDPVSSRPAETASPENNQSVKDGLQQYLEARHKEDDDFFEMLDSIAKMLIEPLGALNSRSEGIEKLKTEFGKSWRGGCRDLIDYDCRPKGLTLHVAGSDKIFRTWTEVYDMLCTIALNRAVNGCTWDEDEDDEDDPEPELPTVRWTSRAQTPPIGEPLLLYELTNAGPVYTPAKYKGGATFFKPGRPGSYGKELTGMAQRFTMWLQFPDPEKFGAAFRVGEPATVSGMDTTPEWRGGEPTREGVYWCKFLINGKLLTRAARWFDDTWHFNNIDTDIRALCVGWWPLPEEA